MCELSIIDMATTLIGMGLKRVMIAAVTLPTTQGWLSLGALLGLEAVTVHSIGTASGFLKAETTPQRSVPELVSEVCTIALAHTPAPAMHAHTRTQARKHSRGHARAGTHTGNHAQAITHILTLMLMLTRSRQRTHSRTLTHNHAHTHAQTRAHTHTRARARPHSHTLTAFRRSIQR